MEPISLVFKTGDRVNAILVALFMHGPAEARDDPVIDLLDGRAGILRQQERLIDDGPGRHTGDIGVRWNGARYGPVTAASRIAAAAGAALCGGQIWIGPADRFEALGPDLIACPGGADENSESTEGVTGED